MSRAREGHMAEGARKDRTETEKDRTDHGR
jgi:hypothetical protein